MMMDKLQIKTTLLRLAGMSGMLTLVMLTASPESHARNVPDVKHPDFTSGQIEFFQKEVTPILKENCVRCHGGNDNKGKPKIKSDFQLLSRKGIVIGGAHGSAFNAKEPSKSRILEMVSYKDEDHEMPPDGKLAESQLATLAKWVEMGMPWEPSTIDVIVHLEEEKHGAFEPGVVSEEAKKWWSNKPLARPAIPSVDNSDWAKHPIDAFVYDQLKTKDLRPNSKADKRSLIRRAYFNLIGLPPSPEEVEAFVNDDSPQAWENLIESLLARPEYGEKWARHWLDVVRYAESNGFERDSDKEFIWRYRDYVIESINEDKPWDRFIMEQIAGDELESPTKDSLIATGYHRLMQWDDEPADRLQHKYDVLDDNVRATSEGFLAMTLGCARCHEHKADPILQEDYYRFMAFFHGVTQMGKNNVIETIPDPEGESLVEQQKKENQNQQENLRKRISRTENQAKQLFLAKDPSIAKLLNPDKVAEPILIPTSEKKPHPWHFTTTRPTADWFEVSFRHEEKWKKAPGPFGQGRPGGKTPNTAWDSNNIWVRTSFQLTEIPSAVELSIFHDENADVYLNGQKIADFNGYVTQYRSLILDKKGLAALQTGRNTLAIHCINTSGAQFIDAGLKIVDRPLSVTELIDQRGTEIFSEKKIAQYQNDRKELEKLANQKFATGIKAMIVQENGGTPQDLFVHVRGSAHSPGDKVVPGFPSIFGYEDPEIKPVAKDAKTSGRRTALAKWMTLPDNPRTSRVAVNRIWQHHFGKGICATPSDFGILGVEPTHPEMLDWIATEFVKQGWSLKNLHRLIMTSKTYQMSSAPNERALAADPLNDNLWRFNMRRLTAEEFRDAILATSAKLNLAKGGPSFFPILPEAVLATSSTKGGKWGRSSDDDLYRRSIYIKIKRSLQPPELIDFDFADTDAPCPVRFTTTVPTQALNSLNSEFIIRNAAEFAARVRNEAGPGISEKHIDFALENALSRPAEKWEIKECMNLLENLRKTGSLTDDQLLERLCLLVLNLNEFMYID